MITKLEYDKIMEMLPPHLFEELDAIDSDDVEVDPASFNKSIKDWIKEKKQDKTAFANFIGIRSISTLRSKLNGKSRFSEKELKKIADLTSIDMSVLLKENPSVSQSRSSKREARIGTYYFGTFDLKFENKCGKGVKRVVVYPAATDEEIIIDVPEKDSKKDLVMAISEKWGRMVDMIIFFDNDTETYIDDLKAEESFTIELKKNNQYETKTETLNSYMLMIKTGKASYECVSYLSKKQAQYFIKEYGNIKTPLYQFVNGRNGGIMCDGKYCLLEDF